MIFCNFKSDLYAILKYHLSKQIVQLLIIFFDRNGILSETNSY